MQKYSDFIDRVFLQDSLLDKLAPKDPSDWELVHRVQAAGDQELSGGKTIGDPAGFQMVRAGLLYALDALAPAHRIFQDAHSDLGSYWHGMMHRREADFDNARYWFRRAGELPVFSRIHHAASAYSHDMAKQITWDPYLFTGQCEQARFGAEELTKELIALQRAEFEVLFDYTWRESKVAG